MLTWWAVGTWAATALGGLTMTALFLRHGGMAQSEREAIGPLRVLPHIGFAVTGFALWVAYAISETDALGWAAMAALAVAFFIAGTFLLTREQHRRAYLMRTRHPAAIAGAATDNPIAAPARVVPAEHFIPIQLASLHGLLGGATLVLVLLERAGVS
jgi:hypothetical protein